MPVMSTVDGVIDRFGRYEFEDDAPLQRQAMN